MQQRVVDTYQQLADDAAGHGLLLVEGTGPELPYITFGRRQEPPNKNEEDRREVKGVHRGRRDVEIRRHDFVHGITT